MVKVLNVAEKPAVAKRLAAILGRGAAQSGGARLSRYNPVYRFRCDVNGRANCDMVLTSVLGHVMELEFVEERSWSLSGLDKLFTAGVKPVAKRNPEVVENLIQAARGCDWLVLWLDCDREGEHIAYEVLDVVKEHRPRIRPFRARFSSLIENDIRRAIGHLGQLDPRLRDAVSARNEIDLRLGAVFTRFQTLRIGRQFVPDSVVSWGPCQFPTLGFVVARYMQHTEFEPEDYWTIDVEYRQEAARTNFVWERGRVYDHCTAAILYELCVACGRFTVVDMTGRAQSKPKPLPLTTVELQMRAARWLRLSSAKTMEIAEALYNRGLISYPRTETDRFSPDADLRGTIQGHSGNSTWGGYCQSLLGGKFVQPRCGVHSDEAHSPIHPTRAVELAELDGHHRAVYELVCRHFFACCSDDAHGFVSAVTINMGGERFRASGLVVEQANYLEIYKYEKWIARNLPQMAVGETYAPTSCTLRSKQTQAPPLLSEQDLIAMMDQKGIGTDATIAAHITKIQERGYAQKLNNVFKPTPLGLALVGAYMKMGVRLYKPYLRAQMEADCKEICEGKKQSADVVRDTLARMKDAFDEVCRHAHVLYSEVASKMTGVGVRHDVGTVVGRAGRCRCGATFSIKTVARPTRNNGRKEIEDTFAVCDRCKVSHLIPGGPVQSTPHVCKLCGAGVVTVQNRFRQAAFVCPVCYSNPPADIESAGQMTCGDCTCNTCPLAGGSSAAALTLCYKRNCAGSIRCSTTSSRCVELSCDKAVRRVEVLDDNCAVCSKPGVPLKRVKVTLRGLPRPHTGCFGGCDGCLLSFDCPEVPTRTAPPPGGLAPNQPPRAPHVPRAAGNPRGLAPPPPGAQPRGQGGGDPRGDPVGGRFLQPAAPKRGRRGGSRTRAGSGGGFGAAAGATGGRGQGSRSRGASGDSAAPRPRKKRRCSKCRQEGHTKTTCRN